MSVNNLDDLTIYDALDPSGMGKLIAGFPDQCRAAWENVMRFNPPSAYRDAEHVLVLGMGGSAIGGDLMRMLAANECRVPITVWREYDAPAWVDARTLVIASSYSGNTEETLSAFAGARANGARLLAVTSGGALLSAAKAAGAPVLTYEFKGQPRAALGYSLLSLLGIIYRLGWINDPAAELDRAIRLIEQLGDSILPARPTATNRAKQLAQRLVGKVPVIYGSGTLGEVAHRWKTQFNENAKTTAAFETMSELNHNTVVGYEYPRAAAADFYVLLLMSARAAARINKRFEVTRQLLMQRGWQSETVEVQGESALAEMLWAIHLGDWVTYYLALLNDVDPMPVEAIDILKNALKNGAK